MPTFPPTSSSDTGSQLAQADKDDPDLLILWPPCPNYWDYRCVLRYPETITSSYSLRIKMFTFCT